MENIKYINDDVSNASADVIVNSKNRKSDRDDKTRSNELSRDNNHHIQALNNIKITLKTYLFL